MKLEMSEEEGELIKRILDNWLSELREEVHHTHDSEFRQHLKHNEHLLRAVLEKLSARRQ
jgi:hypothetical protein